MALSHVMNIISNAGSVAAGAGAGGGGGGGSSLDSQTVTVGSATSASGGSGAPSGSTTRSGFLISGAGGSISDGTSNVYGGASILEIEYQWDTTYPIAVLSLTINGMGRANSGWTTLTIGTTSYQRAAATYASGAQSNGGNSGWFSYPSSYDYTGAANPFAATGQTTTCVFT